MKAIWKYPLQTVGVQSIDMPVGADLLTVQLQHGLPCVWVLVDPAAPACPVKLTTYGTGAPIDDAPGEYLGTYQLAGGSLVFHVFKEPDQTA